LDKAVNYTIEHNPLDSILGRMGSEIGQGIASSVQQQLQTEQDLQLR
jgi:protease-4